MKICILNGMLCVNERHIPYSICLYDDLLALGLSEAEAKTTSAELYKSELLKCVDEELANRIIGILDESGYFSHLGDNVKFSTLANLL